MNHSQRTVIVIGLAVMATIVAVLVAPAVIEQDLPKEIVRLGLFFLGITAVWVTAAVLVYEGENRVEMEMDASDALEDSDAAEPIDLGP